MQIDVDESARNTAFLGDVLTLYRPEQKGEGVSEPAQDIDAAQIKSLVREAHQSFKRRRSGGDAVAKAVMELTSADWDEAALVALVAESSKQGETGTAASANMESESVGQLVYDLAIVDFESDRIERAATLLAILAYLGTDVADALAGLAVCAARLDNFDAALLLASECLKLPVKHPRAYFVAGLAEFKRGNRKAAQSLLAAAARFARQRPEFRADMHAAQRLLLILHFG